VVATFARAVRPLADVVALYAVGSLASGDYRPAASDLDLVAVVAAPLGSRQRRELRRFHEMFEREHPAAVKLHCIYVPRDGLADAAAKHPMWAHRRFGQRQLSGVARAELLRNAIIVDGPPPSGLLPPVDDRALRVAVRAELTGYWKRTLRWPWIWLTDWCVDLGLLTLARAEAALSEGRLITKREALGRLGRFGVPADLVQQIGRRRQGEGTPLRVTQRIRRGYTAHRLVARGLRTLISPGGSRGSGSGAEA
jgi:Nucleotidyltransferase domain